MSSVTDADNYPSPTRSICTDTVVDVCVSYPEHMYMWEGYGNRFVSLCVCVCVCLSVCVSPLNS